jgi:ribose-phosphate pyrophosphokinase
MIILDGTEVKVEHFPDGTQRIVLENLPNMEWRNTHEITWKFEREEELSTLIYVTRHLRNMPCIQEICLNLLYLPNARMDRIHSHKEVFTLRGFADAINWLRFDVVRVLDVHSNVGAALLNNVLVCTPEKYLTDVIKRIGEDNLILYFPDEGAAKRYSGLFQNLPYCYGEKKREWETGRILGLDIRTNGIELAGQTVLMIDDIIAYGGSLYYSAQELKRHGVKKIYAYATHTENSILDREKGTLIKSLVDHTVERLFTTGSLFIGEHDKITVLEV